MPIPYVANDPAFEYIDGTSYGADPGPLKIPIDNRLTARHGQCVHAAVAVSVAVMVNRRSDGLIHVGPETIFGALL